MKEGWLYFARDGGGYRLCAMKMMFFKHNKKQIRNTWDTIYLCKIDFERATKRKLKVGEQIRIPESRFAGLFKNAETIK